MKRKVFSLLPVMGLMLSLVMANSHAFALERPSIPVTTEINANSTIDQIREELKTMDVYVFDFKLKDGAFPTFDVVTPPEGCVGLSLANNEYVTGALNISYRGEIKYESGEWVKKESGVKLKVRGNTSSAEDGVKKLSYKLKLEKKADLMFTDDSSMKDKEWVLHGEGAPRWRYIAGLQVGSKCGLGWEPHLRHVAVIINDRYMGCYYLFEAIGGAKHKVNIKDSGYIVENDAYWWKPDEVYFKTNHQERHMGWTFKEPDTDDFDEMSLDNIKWVINTVEQRLYSNSEVDEYIDYKSFAQWILAHDIMNTYDSCGSNIFVKKRDFNPLNPFESKLEMGPLWDFDSCLLDERETFSQIHSTSDFWFFKLFMSDNFKNTYTDTWKELRDNLKRDVMAKVEEYICNNPDAYKALLIDFNRGLLNDGLQTPYDAYENLSNWFDKRIPILNKLILGEDSGIEELEGGDVNTSGNVSGQEEGLYYTVDGLPAAADAEGILIHVDPSGKTSKIRK